ncbi:serine protease FAM111A-like [Cavia porcellus]|uniref:serine protease FAM111A-like n=1 Tax=Cavia porcellus TaxID=10141 RepID=UPI000184CB80|nr:protein FAM111A-like [Cavia porcellus]
MSCQKPKFRKMHKGKNMKIEDFFSQVPREQQNDTHSSQKKVQSRKRLRDITSTQGQEYHLPKKIAEDKTTHPKKIYITFGKNDNMTYELAHSERASLYEALNTLKAVKENVKSHQNKQMLVKGIKGIMGYLNLAMPFSCIPNESTVDITFSKHASEQKEDNPIFGQQDRPYTDCVKFYVYAIGQTIKRIVKCKELHKEGNKLCVFGFKGEKIKEAVCKDHRFLPFLENGHWQLISNKDSIIENTQVVDDMEGKVVHISAKRRSSLKKATQNAELEKSRFPVLKEYIVEEYPCLKRERENFRENLKKEMKATGKERTTLVRLHRTNFGKQTKNSTPVKTIKHLSRVSDSVGFLHWDNNGNMGTATCFVFTGPYIFTCRHVVDLIVGRGVELSKWADIISHCARVTFSYEEFESKDQNSFSIESWFEISDVDLDYAVLKLKENGQEVPVGLYNRITPAPANGLVYIIGHPAGERKSTDACVMIPQSERKETCERNVRELVPEPQFAHMYTQNSFREILHNPNVVTYDTTFYWGSSGSPVFDSHGSLVAMHTAGCTEKYGEGTFHIIEFGSAMQAILSDIKQKYLVWYEQECVNQQDVEMPSLE